MSAMRHLHPFDILHKLQNGRGGGGAVCVYGEEGGRKGWHIKHLHETGK